MPDLVLEVSGNLFALLLVALLLLLSINEREAREEHEGKGEKQFALGSDVAKRPSHHLEDDNVLSAMVARAIGMCMHEAGRIPWARLWVAKGARRYQSSSIRQSM